MAVLAAVAKGIRAWIGGRDATRSVNRLRFAQWSGSGGSQPGPDRRVVNAAFRKKAFAQLRTGVAAPYDSGGSTAAADCLHSIRPTLAPRASPGVGAGPAGTSGPCSILGRAQRFAGLRHKLWPFNFALGKSRWPRTGTPALSAVRRNHRSLPLAGHPAHQREPDHPGQRRAEQRPPAVRPAKAASGSPPP